MNKKRIEMEKKSNKKKILVALIVLVILAAIVIIAVVQRTEKSFEKSSDAIPISFETSGSTLNSEILGYSVKINRNGNVLMNLESSEYLVSYSVKECTNPSDMLDYVYTSPSGENMKYDPLIERVIVSADGSLVKQELSSSEKEEAILKEKIYILEIEGAKTNPEIVMNKVGVNTFKADGEIKFWFRPKCSDAVLTLKLYKI